MTEKVTKGHILPTNVDLDSYTFNESINQIVADGTVTSTLPSLDVTTAKQGIFYAGKEYELIAPGGRFKGIANSTDDSNELRIYKQTPEGMSILSSAYALNRIRTVPPFEGTLTQYFDMLAELTGFSGRRVIRWPSNKTICELGYFGNVFEGFSALVTSLDMDINFFYDTVIIAPGRKIELDSHILKGLPDVQYADGVDSRWIKTNYYICKWYNQFMCYPFFAPEEIDNPGDIWLPPLDIVEQNIISVDNIGMGKGAYIEQDIELSSSLVSINQPVCSLPLCIRLTGSTTVVYAFTGTWGAIGEEIGTTPLVSDLTDQNKPFVNAPAGKFCLVTENNVEYYSTVSGTIDPAYRGSGDDTVMANVSNIKPGDMFNRTDTNTRWDAVNDPLFLGDMTIEEAIRMPNAVSGSYYNDTDYQNVYIVIYFSPDFNHATGTGTYEYFYHIGHIDNPQVFAETGLPLYDWRSNSTQWVQWGSYTGQSFNNTSDLDNWLAANPDLGNTNGIYTIVGSHGFPIMPELWQSRGGKLEVEINPDTRSVKVKVWGADITLGMPVYVNPPIYTSGYSDGDIVGFDKSGRATHRTMWFVLTDGEWVYDDSIQSFPYAPYKVAITAGNTDYNGLYLTGKGVKFEQKDVTFESPRWDDLGDSTDKESLTVEIDNQYIHTALQAGEVCQDYDAYSNGSSFTFSADCVIPELNDFIGARLGSYDDVLDYMFYYGYQMGADGTYNEFESWWAQRLNKADFTYADVSNAVMDDIEHHISSNVFGRISGCRIMVANRGMFRITDVSITPTNMSISGYQDTRFGDLDNLVFRTNPSLNFGDLDDLFTNVQTIERLGDWTLGLRNQEPARLTV